MKFTILILLLPLSAWAQTQEAKKTDILSICMDKPIEQPLVVIDDGFCHHFLESETESLIKENLLQTENGFNLDPLKCLEKEAPTVPLFKPVDKWKIRFYASHSYTTYFNSDISFKSSRYTVDIKDYEWAERSSREFFEPQTWKKPGNNPFQLIDEPSNTFTVSIEKNGNEFFLSAFHPKFLQANNQVKYMKGTIDGVEVDGVQNVNEPFDGYNQRPGESELVRNENTHKQMTFELGYGRRFDLLKGKYGSLSYIPSIGVGVMVGQNYSVMIKKDEWWQFEDGADPYGVQGFGGSLTNRVELNTPKERFGLFYENKLSFYKQEHGFMDGTQKYNIGYMGNSVGMKFMIYNPKNRKKRTPAVSP